MKKRNKGITLIALIITIIIMLILVAVSIDLIVNDQLFNSAGDAVSKTNEKVEYQQNRVDGLMGVLDKASLEYEIVSDYAANLKLICIYTNNVNEAYKYNNEFMYDITDSGYTHNGKSYAKIYGTVITEEFNLEKLEIVERTAEVQTITYDMDVNGDGQISGLDAVVTLQVANNEGGSPTKEQSLKADIDKNKKVEDADSETILRHVADLE